MAWHVPTEQMRKNNLRHREYKREWMWKKRHPGEPMPKYIPRPYAQHPKHRPKVNKGNAKWIALMEEDRAWKREHRKSKRK